MISELKDDEILDFLMTSEFEGDYSPEELKYLLLKWRYFYRVTNGSFERSKTESDGVVRKLNDEIENLKIQYNNALVNIANKENIIGQISNRKLTWKERFTGKIITKKDEN